MHLRHEPTDSESFKFKSGFLNNTNNAGIIAVTLKYTISL